MAEGCNFLKLMYISAKKYCFQHINSENDSLDSVASGTAVLLYLSEFQSHWHWVWLVAYTTENTVFQIFSTPLSRLWNYDNQISEKICNILVFFQWLLIPVVISVKSLQADRRMDGFADRWNDRKMNRGTDGIHCCLIYPV